MKLRSAIFLTVFSAPALLAPNIYSAQDRDESKTDWSPPHMIPVPSVNGNVKGLVRTRPLPRKGGQEEDEQESRVPVINVKMLFVPSKHLLWMGASEYDTFFVLKDKITALHATAGTDLSISVLNIQIPNSDDPDKALLEELERRFEKIAERPLRYQSWVSLRKLFGPAAFTNEHDARIYSVPKIAGVSFDHDRAVITLMEQNGMKSTMTFDADSRIVAASRDGHPISLTEPITPQKLTTDRD
jgi:hypothetical protein